MRPLRAPRSLATAPGHALLRRAGCEGRLACFCICRPNEGSLWKKELVKHAGTSHVVDDEAVQNKRKNRSMPHPVEMRFEVGGLLCASSTVARASWPRYGTKAGPAFCASATMAAPNGSYGRSYATAGKWHEVDWTGWYVEHYEFAAKRPDWTSSVRHFDAVTALINQAETTARRDQYGCSHRAEPPKHRLIG